MNDAHSSIWTQVPANEVDKILDEVHSRPFANLESYHYRLVAASGGRFEDSDDVDAYVGVEQHPDKPDCYIAYYRFDGVTKTILGTFDTLEKAAEKYDEVARMYNRAVNFPRHGTEEQRARNRRRRTEGATLGLHSTPGDTEPPELCTYRYLEALNVRRRITEADKVLEERDSKRRRWKKRLVDDYDAVFNYIRESQVLVDKYMTLARTY